MALNVLTTDLTGTISVLNADAGQSMLVPVPASSIGGSLSQIVWRPDGSGDAVAWSDVLALLGSNVGVRIVCDQYGGLYEINVEGVSNVRGAWLTSPLFSQAVTVHILDVCQVQDLAGVNGGILLSCENNSGPALLVNFTAAASYFGQLAFFNGAQITNLSTAFPAVEAGDGAQAVTLLVILNRGGAIGGGNPFPVFNALQSGIFFVATAVFGPAVGTGAVAGDAPSVLTLISDGTLTLDVWAAWFGVIAQVPLGQDGGNGPTTLRPSGFGSVPIGNWFFDTTIRSPIYWNAQSEWNTLDVVGIDPGHRVDQSVNSGRVENPYSTQPILRTTGAGNVAGGFNGAGTGNKAILGLQPDPITPTLPLAAFLSFTFTFTDLTGLGAKPYANVVLDLNGTGTAYAIAVIDPASAPILANGTATPNVDGSTTWTWNGTLDNLLIVNGLVGPPNPPGVGFVPPTVPGAPLPGGWLSNSWSVAAILAAYPACQIAPADTLDNGLPKSPNVSLPYLLIAGDSNNQKQLAIQLKNLFLNSNPL